MWLFIGSVVEPWSVKEGEGWCLGLTHICYLGLCFYFSTDEILLFLCKHLFFFPKFCRHYGNHQPGPQLGGISQPLVKGWVQTRPNSATRRKLNTWLWREKSTCAWWMKQRGKNPLGNTCCCVDCAQIVVSPGLIHQGTGKLPLKDIRPSEDPFNGGVGKKCTRCVQLAIFWWFRRVCCLTDIGPELMNSRWGSWVAASAAWAGRLEGHYGPHPRLCLIRRNCLCDFSCLSFLPPAACPGVSCRAGCQPAWAVCPLSIAPSP